LIRRTFLKKGCDYLQKNYNWINTDRMAPGQFMKRVHGSWLIVYGKILAYILLW